MKRPPTGETPPPTATRPQRTEDRPRRQAGRRSRLRAGRWADQRRPQADRARCRLGASPSLSAAAEEPWLREGRTPRPEDPDRSLRSRASLRGEEGPPPSKPEAPPARAGPRKAIRQRRPGGSSRRAN